MKATIANREEIAARKDRLTEGLKRQEKNRQRTASLEYTHGALADEVRTLTACVVFDDVPAIQSLATKRLQLEIVRLRLDECERANAEQEADLKNCLGGLRDALCTAMAPVFRQFEDQLVRGLLPVYPQEQTARQMAKSSPKFQQFIGRFTREWSLITDTEAAAESAVEILNTALSGEFAA